MKNIFESVIEKGSYDLPSMLKKIDSYHIAGKLTDQEQAELYTLARNNADLTNNLDFLSKLLELVDQLNDLQDRVAKLDGAAEQLKPDQAPSDYVAGKWYQNGDRITFEGAVYTCTAPEGMVCTWSPAEYPAYWESITE